MGKNYRTTFLTVLAVVIIGAGFLIYGWNLMRGRNLAQPPEFDSSVFPSLEDYVTLEEFLNAADLLTGPAAAVAQPAEPDAGYDVQAGELPVGYIYFKNAFRLSTVEKTNELIQSFLNDFPALKDLPLENLAAQNSDYAARLNYELHSGELDQALLNEVESALEKLRNEYADVVLVK